MDVKQFLEDILDSTPNLPRKCYTGVGSRDTPSEIKDVMQEMASILEKKGYVLRTGDADGADSAFRAGVKNQDNINVYTADDSNDLALQFGEQYHPAWEKVGSYGRKLHARNSFQVLGDDLEDPRPSFFLICWTPDGATSDDERSIDTGGTGQAISIADDFGVPVYNLKKEYETF